MSHLPHPTLPDLRRVNVVGVSGSGKSTFARQLSSALAVEHIEMDALYWEPNWNEPTTEAFRERLSEAITGETWVLDGNYHSKTHDIKWSHATSIVWLDMSLSRTLWRAVGRALHRAWTKEELWAGTGNRESFVRSFLSHESVVLWTLTSYKAVGKRYQQCQSNNEYDVPFYRLSTPKEVERFLATVESLTKAEADSKVATATTTPQQTL